MNLPTQERSPLDQKLIAELVKKASSEVSEILVVDQVDSTNQWAIELIKAGKSNFALAADYQTHGKGRLQRIWQAPARSSILLTICLEQKNVTNLGWLNLWAALTVKKILSESVSFEIKIKWPNDLVVEFEESYLKFGGILSQIQQHQVIFGIGINYSQELSELPVPTATSLKLLSSSSRSREDLIAELISGIFTAWQSESESSRFPTSATVREYRHCSFSLGRSVKVELSNGEIILGEAIDLTDTGALLVKTKTGVIHTVTAGDVN
jgi:BirA family transcriptional regulator, biotin operon repressor / biotin---[acetyl-CoA-carboxylase] ligase